MNTFTLSIAMLRHRLLATLLHIITFAAGIAMIIALLLCHAQIEQEESRNLQGIDLVVGSKGSPMQLILSTVLHIDIPTGNIPLSEADKLSQNPMVKEAIPMALGDNYQGFRIVGTTVAYPAHYNAVLKEGRFWHGPMEVTLGADVARKAKLHLGDSIIGAHGLVNSDDLHSNFPYKVVGILAPTGTVIDRVVLTAIESVWHVHEHPDPDDAEEIKHAKEHPEKEITALLIAYKSPYAAVFLPRLVNSTTAMQAASPAMEVARLMKFMRAGSDVITVFGCVLIFIACLGLFTTLYTAMQERRYDIALLRCLGASRLRVAMLVLCESLILAALGTITGMMLGHGLLMVAALPQGLELSGWVFLPEELLVALAGLIIGIFAALIPAIQAYRVPVFQTLVAR